MQGTLPLEKIDITKRKAKDYKIDITKKDCMPLMMPEERRYGILGVQ